MSRGRLLTALHPEDLTEAQFTTQVVDTASAAGFRRYHTYRSERSPAGWPDEAFVRDRLILAELKRCGAKPSDHQVQWLNALAQAGQEVYLWYPTDLDEIARIFGTRWWEFRGFRRYSEGTCQHGCLIPLGEGKPAFRPSSLWDGEHGCRLDQIPAQLAIA